jgi:hypothetical protein
MQFLVIVRVLETAVGPDDARVRRELGPAIQRILASGKIAASGTFAGIRCGFFLINVDAPEDIFTTLGKVIIENFHVDIYPTMPFAKLSEVFAMYD